MISPEKITNINPYKEKSSILDKIKEGLNSDQEKKLKAFEEEIRSGIKDPEEAIERIMEMRKITSPVISVPKKYYSEIRKDGISAKPDWTGHKSLAATLGREPFTALNEERLYFKIKPHVPVEPRFTAPANKKDDDLVFRGVVLISENYNKLDLNRDLEQI